MVGYRSFVRALVLSLFFVTLAAFVIIEPARVWILAAFVVSLLRRVLALEAALRIMVEKERELPEIGLG